MFHRALLVAVHRRLLYQCRRSLVLPWGIGLYGGDVEWARSYADGNDSTGDWPTVFTVSL